MSLVSTFEEYKTQFQKNKSLLTFDQFLSLMQENPEKLSRGSARYTVDMLDHFGKKEIQLPEGKAFQFKLFENQVIGLESVQTEIYQTLQSFAHIGTNNRLLLLHGPNGSAKSTLIQTLMQGIEDYSRTSEGALYTFSWVFPVDKIVRGGLGIQGSSAPKKDSHQSYALLEEENVASIIPCELQDSPVLLIPAELRKDVLGKAYEHLPQRLKVGGLPTRDQKIFEALLTTAHGDLGQVLRHIRVERLYLSRTYRKGLVTVEPQMHVDANYQQLTLNKAYSALPTSLQGVSLFTLSGDLVDANRGMIDYADLLKRPLDSFKYLLTACETGTVNVGPVILALDTVFIGSSNELQLDGFKEYPDFGSFKGRLELVRVPYLLKVSSEQKIYSPIMKQIAGTKGITPHVDWAISFWAVLSRLKKPNRDLYPNEVRTLIDRIRPIDKLRLLESGELPDHWTQEERYLLKPYVQKLILEYRNVPYYEGRTGASARELKGILVDAAQNSDFRTLSPLSVIAELRNFVQRTTEYEFLRMDALDGYHDVAGFIDILLNEYTEIIDHEVRDSMGLYEKIQWSDFLKKYIVHLSVLLKKEKIKNPITGKTEDPDISLIKEFETIVQAPGSEEALEQYRRNLISQIGAWVLDHPKEAVDYFKIFPELKQRLEKHYFESQKNLLSKMHGALQVYGTEMEDMTSDGTKLAHQTLQNMQDKLGYTLDGAKEVIVFLLKRRYS